MENRYDKLEQYAKGRLKQNDLDAFEKEMEKDKELALEADFYKKAAHVFENIQGYEQNDALLKEVDGMLEAENFFENLEEELLSTTAKEPEAKVVDIIQRKPSRIMRVLSLAASFLVLVVAGSFIFANTNYSNSSLANTDSVKVELSGLRNEDNGNIDSFNDGIKAMEIEDYEQATNFFRELPTTDKAYREAQLYLALAQLKTGKYEQAAVSAANAQETDLSGRRQDADWILVQTLLAQSKQSELQELLEEIAADRNHNYGKEAEKLQQQLNSFWRGLIF